MTRLLWALILLLAWPPVLYAQRTTGGALSSNTAIVLDVSGQGTASVTVFGTFSGTINFEVGNGGPPADVDCTPPSGGSAVNNTTSAGTWVCSVAGFSQFIARMSDYVSGSAVIAMGAAPGGGGAAGGGGVASEVSISQTGNENAVDVLTVIPGTGANQLGKAEDAASAGGDTGVAVFAIRDDTLDARSGTEGDFEYFHLNANGALWVLDVNSAALLAEMTAAAASLDSIVTGAAPDAAHDNPVEATGPQLHLEAKTLDGSALPNTVSAEGDAVRAAAALNGVQYQALINVAGTKELVKLEDDAHASADLLVPVGQRRIDSLASSGGTSGDYVTANQTAEGATWTAQSATTNGGCTPGSSISTAAVLETEIKATAGQLYQLVITNIDATAVFARLYNDTAANTDETDTPVQRFVVPTQGDAKGAGFALPVAVGQQYTTAITLRVTTGAADNDTGALSANEVFVSYCYK